MVSVSAALKRKIHVLLSGLSLQPGVVFDYNMFHLLQCYYQN